MRVVVIIASILFLGSATLFAYQKGLEDAPTTKEVKLMVPSAWSKAPPDADCQWSDDYPAGVCIRGEDAWACVKAGDRTACVRRGP